MSVNNLLMFTKIGSKSVQFHGVTTVPDGFENQYAELFDHPMVQRVLLLPTADKLVERMQNRAGALEEDLVEFVPWFYSYLDPMSKDG